MNLITKSHYNDYEYILCDLSHISIFSKFSTPKNITYLDNKLSKLFDKNNYIVISKHNTASSILLPDGHVGFLIEEQTKLIPHKIGLVVKFRNETDMILAKTVIHIE